MVFYSPRDQLWQLSVMVRLLLVVFNMYHYTINNDYAWHNICSAWFLVIRISTFHSNNTYYNIVNNSGGHCSVKKLKCCSYIVYGKTSTEKKFHGFHGFYSIVNFFLRIMALSTCNIRMSTKMLQWKFYHEKPFSTQKFSPANVFPYTVHSLFI